MKAYDSEEYQKRIDLYIYGLMDKNQSESFEKEISENPELQSEVHFQRLGQISKFLSMKEQLKTVYREKNSPFQEWWRKPIFIRVAASLLIGILGLVIWNSVSDYNKEKLAQQEKARIDSLKHREEIQFTLKPKTQEITNILIEDSKQPLQNIPSELKIAATDFEKGNFDKASKLLEKPKISEKTANVDTKVFGSSPDDTPNNNTPKTDPKIESYRAFYQGLILLRTNKFDAAIAKFKIVGEPLKEDARWYTALAYLQKKEVSKGQELLQEIVKNSTNDEHKQDAQTLLDSMKE